jgi:hypothetical protein
MQVRRHVGSQAGGGRRPVRVQRKVVHARLLHAHVPEVEALGSQTVCAKQRPRRGQVAAIAPGSGDGRRVHGGERRRHLHGAVGALPVVLGNGCGVITSVCGPAIHSGAAGEGVQSISIQGREN